MSALVLALNPSVDVEWRVDHVRWEEKNSIHSERRWPGGKGVNVARWLKFLGSPSTLLLPLGGQSGKEISNDLRREKISMATVPVSDPTRVNVIVTTKSQGQLRFNPPGPKISFREWQSIGQKTKVLLRRAETMVLSGSLPRGIGVGAYAQFVRLGRQSSVKVVLDCDGDPFREALAAKPFLVKPNEFELAQWCGTPLKTESELVHAAQKLSTKTEGWVLVSRGAKGAMLLHADEEQLLVATAPKVPVVNTVGAGDALLAAVVWQIEKQASPVEWLRWGIAAGTAAVQRRAGELPSFSEVKQLAAKIRIKAIP